MLKKFNFHLENMLMGEGIWFLPSWALDRLLFHVLFKYVYRARFNLYGKNIKWGRNFSRRLIPSSVRISCPHKISIGDDCCIDGHVYLQCHFEGEGLMIGKGTRINAHVHILSFSRITLGEKVLLAPFVLISSGNHGHQEDCAIMEQKMMEAGPIDIGSGVWIGQNAKILGLSCVSKNSVVGAGTIVKGVFKDRSIIAGIPAKIIKAL